jgi:hypothetical protein
MGRLTLSGRSDTFHGAKFLVINTRSVGQFLWFIVRHCQHQNCTASNDGMIDDELERIWKEILSRYLFGGTEENHHLVWNCSMEATTCMQERHNYKIFKMC